MICFLTGNPFVPNTLILNPANGFADGIGQALRDKRAALYVCSDPFDPAWTDECCRAMGFGFENAGLPLTAWRALDGRNAAFAPQLVQSAGLIVLGGGHVPTQNAFFQAIRLRELLRDFPGVILGISAGSMNSAETVYAQPELPGEASSKDYRRFLPGLGLTKTMLLPHYQALKNETLDGLRVFEDISYPDSMDRAFYAIPDGSYLLIRDGEETIRGEAYRIAEGKLEQIAKAEEIYAISSENTY